MALNWDNVATTTKKNTGLNWDKVNTSMANKQAFNIMNQATQKGNAKSYNEVVQQPTSQADLAKQLPEYKINLPGISNTTPTVQELSKNLNMQESKSRVAKIGDAIVSTLYGLGEKPAKGIANATLGNETGVDMYSKMVYNGMQSDAQQKLLISALKRKGYSDEEIDNQLQQVTNNAQEKNDKINNRVAEDKKRLNKVYEQLDKTLGKNETAKSIGNAIGYLGLAPTTGYGVLSAINARADTEDPLDIAMAAGTGEAFGAISNKFGGLTKGALGKIGATSTNLPANFLKNFASGFAGIGGASLTTGTLTDLYNKVRGRDINYANTLKNAAISGLVGGAMQGVTGTINDVKQAKAQMQADYKNTAEEVENMRNIVERSDAKNQSQKVKDAVARKYEPRINEAIEKFEDTKYLGQGKIQANLVEQLKQGNTTPVQVQNTINTLALPATKEINNLSEVTETPENSLAVIDRTELDKLQTPKETWGYRDTEKISGLDDSIKQNGVQEPILIATDRNGNLEIYDGHHRLEIAKKYGIEKVPIKYIGSSDYSLDKPTTPEYNEGIERLGDDDGIYGASKGNRENTKEIQNINRYNSDNIIQSEGSGTTRENAEIRTEVPGYNDGPSSRAIYNSDTQGNRINETKNSNNQSSFSMPENNLQTKYPNINLNKNISQMDGIPAIELEDGSILPITTNDTHVEFIRNNGLDVNDIKSGGWIGNGIYEPDYRSDTNKYVEQEKAKQRVAEKRASRKRIAESQPSNIFEETNKMIQDNRTKAVEEGAKTLGLEKANENLSTYKKQMFQNNANAINDLIKAKSETLAEFDNKIAIKKQELAGKKDQTTKVAQTLRQQITNLEKRKTDAEANFINKIDRLENRNATINKLKTQVSEDRLPTKQEVKNKIITDKDIESINLDNAKNLSKFIMNNTTPQRVNEKIFDKDTAAKINDKFFKPIKHNEAERIRFLNKEREDIKSWGIEPKSRESAAVQMYGEREYVNPETGEKSAYTLNDLKREFPNDWEKIKNASEQARAKYDTYIDEINKELNKMGYDSIPKRNDYFRHFEQTASLLDTFGIPSKANALPTDMNGLTADLRPGKNFFANALQRKGDKTTYDAITGIDGYLEGASKLRYHTEDIQNLRTLDDYIRGKYGSKADLEGLSKEEFNKRVKQIQEGHLSEYASWLTEYTNSLAGKKSRLDRGTEEAFGRSVYGTLNALKKQVGSNLTGLNINSALSNFISAGQGLSSTSKVATVQGLVDTIKNVFKNDDFIDKSDFLTTRFGSDKLSKTLWEKASDVGQTFMSATDYFTANLITRSKYHEYLNKGYPEQEALEKAGEYADRIMAGRGLGDMPNFFNSKTLGILTQFQLENVNQFDSMFHDNFTTDRASEQTKYDAKTWNEKIKSKFAKASPKFYNGLSATFTLAQLFAAGWAFNKIVKELGGTGGAFDPIGTIEDLVKDYQKDGLETATKNFVKNVVDDIPYANLITGGGRIPMKDSLPNLYDLLTGESTVGKELTKLANVLPPTGGGQVRKTIQGLKTLINNGEYGTRNGNEYAKWLLDLDKKDVPQKIITSLKALAFGKYGPEEAKEYIDSGYKGLTVTQTNAFKEIKDTGMSASEFRKWVDVLDDINPKKVDKYGKEKVDANAKKAQLKTALDSPSLSDEQKKILYEMFYKITE